MGVRHLSDWKLIEELQLGCTGYLIRGNGRLQPKGLIPLGQFHAHCPGPHVCVQTKYHSHMEYAHTISNGANCCCNTHMASIVSNMRGYIIQSGLMERTRGCRRHEYHSRSACASRTRTYVPSPVRCTADSSPFKFPSN